jgi:hypothetical protein
MWAPCANNQVGKLLFCPFCSVYAPPKYLHCPAESKESYNNRKGIEKSTSANTPGSLKQGYWLDLNVTAAGIVFA